MITGTYNLTLVALTFVVACMASYASLEFLRRVADTRGSTAPLWLVAGSICMGFGIWTMHYTGMAAIGYRPRFVSILLEQPYSNSSMAYLLSGVCLVFLLLSQVSSRVGERMSAVDAGWRGAKQDADVLGQILDNLAKEVYIARYIADADAWKIVYVNQGAVRNLGYSRGELVSMSPDQINAEMHGNEIREVVAPLLDGTTSLVTLETTHRRADDSVYPVELQVQLVMGNDEPTLVVIATDVTEKRQKEEQLRQSKKLESIGQLASGIAHEINTPAQYVGDNIRFVKTAVNDLIELVEQLLRLHRAALAGEVTTSLAEEVEEVVNSIDPSYIVADIPDAIEQSLDGITRIASIVRAMKDFAHPGGKDPEFVDLNHVLRNTIIVASNEWKYVADLDQDLDDSLPPVPCLQQEISQVVLNLIVNAAHAITEANADAENKMGRISVSSRLDGDFAVVCVSDTGAGVPEEIRERVFDPFFTTKEVGKGTGQGLALAYQSIVNTHGGSIDIDSGEGQGTTFTLRLPLQMAASEETEAVA